MSAWNLPTIEEYIPRLILHTHDSPCSRSLCFYVENIFDLQGCACIYVEKRAHACTWMYTTEYPISFEECTRIWPGANAVTLRLQHSCLSLWIVILLGWSCLGLRKNLSKVLSANTTSPSQQTVRDTMMRKRDDLKVRRESSRGLLYHRH